MSIIGHVSITHPSLQGPPSLERSLATYKSYSDLGRPGFPQKPHTLLILPPHLHPQHQHLDLPYKLLVEASTDKHTKSCRELSIYLLSSFFPPVSSQPTVP